MRIPLDYYRILGVPIQATVGQISQAYKDRVRQLPRREYSNAAITARKQLLEEAYTVLSDEERRCEYDANFLLRTTELEPPQQELSSLDEVESLEEQDKEIRTPCIEIQADQFVGVLLILLELGEYELLLKLGYPYLDNNLSLEQESEHNPQLVRADVVLTLALACLEMGREQWQQKQYEDAAMTWKVGQKLLLQENLFPGVRDAIKNDYDKLRPYRILELLALPKENTAQRHKGFQLLKQMLQERGGIDGVGDDYSGLNIDEFLRFIQQLRHYLTTEEQQQLFEAESRRPSAVATYLAVYALIARGFAQRLPALIFRAKAMLLRLGRHQDVYLEQAICALLLGQTEEANYALELSQDYEALAFIREHSHDSPDLLPGLCLYGENWLQTEVFPHFQDLANLQATSLKDYFADQAVQAYLEQLPVETTSQKHNSVVESEKVESQAVAPEQSYRQHSWDEKAGIQQQGLERQKLAPSATILTASREGDEARQRLANLTPASENSKDLSAFDPSPTSSFSQTTGRRRRRQRRLKTKVLAPLERFRDSKKSGQSLVSSPHQPRSKAQFLTKNKRLLLLTLVGLLGTGVSGFVAVATFKWLKKTLQSPPAIVAQKEQEQLFIQINQPPVEIPSPSAPPVASQKLVGEDIAQQTIENWLATKAKALGSNYQVEQLNNILTEPLLSQWRGTAAALKRNQSYWQYQHNVKVESVNFSEEQPNQATVEAAVKEDAKLYSAGKLNQSASYNDNLRVRYDLVRQNNQWRIQEIKVLQ